MIAKDELLFMTRAFEKWNPLRDWTTSTKLSTNTIIEFQISDRRYQSLSLHNGVRYKE